MGKNIFIENIGDRDELKQVISEAVTEVLNRQNKPVKYITRAEAARKYHLSLPSIDKGIRNNTLESVRIGARVLIVDSND